MTKSKPKTFSIYSNNKILLQAILQDLEKKGFCLNKKEKFTNKTSYIHTTLKSFNNSNTIEDFKVLSLSSINPNSTKSFNLPEDYMKVLSFVDNQLKIKHWESVFKLNHWYLTKDKKLINYQGNNMFYGIDENDKWFELCKMNLNQNDCALAGETYIHTKLENEAIKRGYKKGVAIETNDVHKRFKGIFFLLTDDCYFYVNTNKLTFGTYNVFLNGKWAPIIKNHKLESFGSTDINICIDEGFFYAKNLKFYKKDLENFLIYSRNLRGILKKYNLPKSKKITIGCENDKIYKLYKILRSFR